MTTKKTENREYNVPTAGVEDWHIPVNENWQSIDSDGQTVLDTAQTTVDALNGGGSGGEA